MNTPASIPLYIHASEFPAQVRRALLDSLRERRVNQKFHYGTYKQASRWQALFTHYSPFINDPECRRIYEQCCREAAARFSSVPIHVVGLGCGSGEKDLKLLEALRAGENRTLYTPVDVSMPLVVTSSQRAAGAGFDVSPGMIADLATAEDLGSHLDRLSGQNFPRRICTCFGLLPNFLPDVILPILGGVVGRGDYVLVSANLAPGGDDHGLRAVLPQYENRLTAEWLLIFLTDLGIDASDGELIWTVERFGAVGSASAPPPSPMGLWGITAHFRFTRTRTIPVEGEEFCFAAGERLRLFFSCRYSRAQVEATLSSHALDVQDCWMTSEEAVLLCRKR